MMTRPSGWRAALAAIALAVLLVALAATLRAVGVLLDTGERLYTVSPWLAAGYGVMLATFAIAAVTVLVWLLRPPRQRSAAGPTAPTEARVQADLERHTESGIDTGDAAAELRELTRRRSAGSVFVAVYGEISSGKSSLIRALVPDARVRTDVRGGTTREITEYEWRGTGGDRICLADVPGFNDVDDDVAERRLAEAVRAHLVVYVCDSDLTRSQWQALETLQAFDKPLIVALNKTDRYADAERARIEARLYERLPGLEPGRVVAIQAGGEEEVTRRTADGSEMIEYRPRPMRVDALAGALQAALDRDGETLSRLRDSAVFLLAAHKLDQAVDTHRRRAAQDIVERHTRHAVIGALAAISPGSDLIIQGVLATRMVRELCALFEVEARAIDIESTLRAASARARKTTGLLLAVAGNALKAFPGIGTVTGGLVHAVAYGLLFDTLGRALVETLATRGELRPQPTAHHFEEMLGENLGTRAKRLARLALESRRGAGDRP